MITEQIHDYSNFVFAAYFITLTGLTIHFLQQLISYWKSSVELSKKLRLNKAKH